MKGRGVPLKNIHVVGHSLGGHVGGFAGAAVAKMVEDWIGRLTLLDPAGPLFEVPLIGPVEEANRASKNNAYFVDAIHTDAFFGMRTAIADTDFFVNGGASFQPGCGWVTDCK